ncbi:hypothetical protein PF003_g26990 [Phytophthora fragariae]|nr:hypothetical protein PF003_g26983 [Phytophthora fragariae]KAE8889069.1 hypothetical protein PF003_g26990 [Phytophthora fragariae]
MKRVNDMMHGFTARSIEEKAQRDQAGAQDDSDPRMDLISLYLDQHAADNGKTLL